MAEQQKQYSFVVGRNTGKVDNQGNQVAAVMAQGFVSRDPEERVSASGSKRLTFSLPLSNTGKKLTRLFSEQAEVADETLWMNVTVFENNNYLFDRVQKSIKKGSFINAIGNVTRTVAQDGRVYYNMILRDFSIKRDSNGNWNEVATEYTFVDATPTDFGALAGFASHITSEPQVTDLNGVKALKFQVEFNKAGKKIAYGLSLSEPAADKVRIGVTLFDPKNSEFSIVDRVSKILQKGSAIEGFGTLTKTDNGYFNLTLHDFALVGSGKSNTTANQTPENPNQDAGFQGQTLDDFAGDPFGGNSIDISDDDLPF